MADLEHVKIVKLGAEAIREWRKRNRDVEFDLNEADLNAADLTGADLSGADLGGADLGGGKLVGVDLRGGYLRRADLRGANLFKANLEGADLRDGNLCAVNLTEANLTGADLIGADLTRADLTKAYLPGADLTGADLTGADLTGVNLTGATPNQTILRNLDFSGRKMPVVDQGSAFSTRLEGIEFGPQSKHLEDPSMKSKHGQNQPVLPGPTKRLGFEPDGGEPVRQSQGKMKTMLAKLELVDFCGFERHEASLRDLTILVGKNNAGKSSLIEALRIISIAIKTMQSTRFVDPPCWTGVIDSKNCAHDVVFAKGVRLDASTVRLDLRTAFYKYNEPPAMIACQFANDVKIKTFLGPNQELHSCLVNQNGRVVETNHEAKRVDIPTISVLPQIGPLEHTEKVLNKTYVRKCLDGHLSSRHFRNQIRFNYDLYDSFCELVHQSWPDVMVDEFLGPRAIHGDELGLLVRENDFVAEVANFGHGLQMWLQIVWFLTRTPPNNLVILDEPDVYMHPVLQQKLIDLIRGRFSQCIISTHANPIIESVEDCNILEVDRHASVSEYRG